MQAIDSFLDTALNHQGLRPMPATPDAPSSPGTVSVLGYASEPASAAATPFAAINPAKQPSGWTVWAGGYGSYGEVGADAAAGTHERISRDFGVAFGADYFLNVNTTVGITGAKGGTNFNIGEFGKGDSDTYHIAIHARTQIDAAYLTGALAYGYSNVFTDRTVTIAGTDRFVANFAAHDVAGHIEGGYKLGWITPYAAVRAQAFMTPAYSEVTIAGVSTYALDYRARTATSVRTELGAGVEWAPGYGADGNLTLRARGAWVHEFGSNNGVAAAFQSLAGAGFTVAGAVPNANSLQVSAGAELALHSGMFLAASLGGRFAADAQVYSGNVKLGYSW